MDRKHATWTGVLTLIAGIVLLFLQGTAIDIVIMVLGGAMTLISLFNIIDTIHQSRKVHDGLETGTMNVGRMISAFVVLGFGLWMLISPAGISTLVLYVVAGLMILGGLYHVLMLGFGFKQVRFPVWLYILPVCLLVGGIVILAIGVEAIKTALALVVGIALIVFAVSTFSEIGTASRYKRIKS